MAGDGGVSGALKFLVTGSGRCGTSSLACWLDGSFDETGRPVRARHESSYRRFVGLLITGRPHLAKALLEELEHEIEVTPFLPLLPEVYWPGVPVYGLVRDGRETVTSGLNTGWGLNVSGEPLHWSQLWPGGGVDRFHASCRFWSRTYERLLVRRVPLLRLEDLIAHRGRAVILDTVGLRVQGPLPRSNPTTRKDLQRLEGKVQPPPKLWSDRHRRVFAEICGPVMDEIYPGWTTRPTSAVGATAPCRPSQS